MDDENQALNDTSEVNTQEESPTAEQTTEEVEQVESTEETETSETGGEGKRTAQSRIRELNSQRKAAEEENRSLKQRLEELTNPVGSSVNNQFPQQTPQDNFYNEDGNIDPVRYRESIIRDAETRAELRIRQSEAVNRINSESEKAMRDYPELDPKSDSYNKDLSDSIVEATEAYVRSNPYTASVEKFVSRLMKPYRGAIDRGVGKASENIAKQVSQAALRPTSARKQEKTAREKSIAELEAELGIVNS